MLQIENRVPTLDEVRQTTNDAIETFFAGKKSDAHELSKYYQQLWDAIDIVVRAGGKRLRPYMVSLAYHAYAKDPDAKSIVPAMLSMELLHSAMLVHDDILDRDDIRHGVKNVSGQFKDLYEALIPDTNERQHYANGAAIIAGDLLLAASLYLLAHDLECPRDAGKRIVRYADQAIMAVCGGELLDTESAFRGIEHADALTIARAKTSTYSFEVPLAIGAILGGASDEDIEALSVGYGISLGQAYQLHDDLLGVFGDDKVTGKSNLGDLREGKRTYLVEQFYALANAEQIARFERAFNNQGATADQFLAAKAMLETSGAKAATEEKIQELISTARDSVQGLAIGSSYIAAFEDLINRAIKRAQ